MHLCHQTYNTNKEGFLPKGKFQVFVISFFYYFVVLMT